MPGTTRPRTAHSRTRPTAAAVTVDATAGIGTIPSGNGCYGSQREQGSHTSKSPDTCAANFLQFRSAMKENGAVNVDWWDEHGGIGTVSTVDGETDHVDQGVFSNGSNGSGYTEPAAETPFAPYYGIEMLSKLGSPGNEMVGSTSNTGLPKVHAVRRAGGGPDILLDNEDPSNADTVSLSYSGLTATGTPTLSTLGNNATSLTSSSGWDSTFTQSGSAVTVVDASSNGAIAASAGTTSIGFNGTDTGSDPAPTVFSLDGTVCSSD